MRKIIFWYKISDFLLAFYYFHFYFYPLKMPPLAHAARGGLPLRPPPPFATPLVVKEKMRSSECMIPSWLATGSASDHNNFASIPLYSTWMTTEMGGVQPVVPRGQPHLPTRNRTMGNPAKLQDGVPVIMKVIDLTPCR